MNVLDLPWDILHDIFLHFRDPRVSTHPGESGWNWQLLGNTAHDDDESVRIQSVKNARLVCRLFNRAASPHLVPWVLVSVSRTSLARVDQISRNPYIASGVRGIKIDASYYPRELADDIERFAARQRHDLQDEEGYISTYFGDEDEEEARANCAFIIKAWVNALSATASGTGSRKSSEYQTLLRDVHSEFRRRHSEVSALVADGSFASSLAQAISRMPAFSSLWIDDKNPRSTRNMHDPLETFNNRASLVNFLVSPFRWCDIEKPVRGHGATPEEGMELSIARLILDLPIAIHQAGVFIRDLQIWVFPRLLRNRSLLDPTGRDQELRDAFQQLERFQLIDKASRTFGRESAIPPERLAPSDRYLAAAVSPPTLRTLRLRFPRSVPYWTRYPAASFIPAVTSNHLTILALEGALVRQSDLDRLCGRLDAQPTFIELSALTLQSGRWSPILDAVRRNTEALCAEKKCRVRLAELVGGEFGEQERCAYVSD